MLSFKQGKHKERSESNSASKKFDFSKERHNLTWLEINLDRSIKLLKLNVSPSYGWNQDLIINFVFTHLEEKIILNSDLYIQQWIFIIYSKWITHISAIEV